MTVPNDDLERIVSGAETIEKSLSVLTAKQSMSREAYRADRETRDVVERRFVKLTEATLDIARTLVVHERGSPPESNPAAMLALDETGVLDRTTTAKMVQAARFRCLPRLLNALTNACFLIILVYCSSQETRICVRPISKSGTRGKFMYLISINQIVGLNHPGSSDRPATRR